MTLYRLYCGGSKIRQRFRLKWLSYIIAFTLKKSFAIMPYSKVQFFTIQTPGFAELVSDSELYLMFSNGFTAKFEFRGSVDIGALGRTISTYVL